MLILSFRVTFGACSPYGLVMRAVSGSISSSSGHFLKLLSIPLPWTNISKHEQNITKPFSGISEQEICRPELLHTIPSTARTPVEASPWHSVDSTACLADHAWSLWPASLRCDCAAQRSTRHSAYSTARSPVASRLTLSDSNFESQRPTHSNSVRQHSAPLGTRANKFIWCLAWKQMEDKVYPSSKFMPLPSYLWGPTHARTIKTHCFQT